VADTRSSRALRAFARRMTKMSARAPRVGAAAKGDLGYSIVVAEATWTPVDTTKALSNWVITNGAPVLEDIPAHFPGVDSLTEPASFAMTQELARAQSRIGSTLPNTPMFIQNNVDYIIELNLGKSLQAPAGWIAETFVSALSRWRARLPQVVGTAMGRKV
jgi:hypothetical protein